MYAALDGARRGALASSTAIVSAWLHSSMTCGLRDIESLSVAIRLASPDRDSNACMIVTVTCAAPRGKRHAADLCRFALQLCENGVRSKPRRGLVCERAMD